MTQKLLPLLHDGGRIVNVSTARTRIAWPGGSVYASMKGALEVMSKHLAKELAPRKIAVNVVAPGAVATDFSGGIVRQSCREQDGGRRDSAGPSGCAPTTLVR